MARSDMARWHLAGIFSSLNGTDGVMGVFVLALSRHLGRLDFDRPRISFWRSGRDQHVKPLSPHQSNRNSQTTTHVSIRLRTGQIHPNHVTMGTAVGCCGGHWEVASDLMMGHVARMEEVCTFREVRKMVFS